MVMTPKQWEIEHITLAKKADAVVIVPATANFINKCAAGIADDFLSTLVLATKAPILICPAMNTNMYENRVVQESMTKLRQRGFLFIEPETGRLACGDEGAGRLASEDKILTAIRETVMPNADYAGQTVLITAGPTQEPLDEIRYISNRSSGKMGYALAREAVSRGARVILVSGPVSLAPPKGVELLGVKTARQMYEKVMANFPSSDIVIASSAVGDFRPAKLVAGKIKKKAGLNLELVANPDILKELGKKKKKKQLLVGFAAESRDLEANAKAKLKNKNLDLIIANKIADSFAKDTNKVTLIFKNSRKEALPVLAKEKLAKVILDKILSLC